MTRTATGPLTRDELQEWYAVSPEPCDHPFVRASFITTLDGRATGPDGTSSGLNEGSEGDAAVFHHLRDWAEVVVVGAGTVREEEYPPLPGVDLLVVSAEAELPPSVQQTVPDAGEVVLLHGSGRELTAGEILAEIEARGWRRVVLEGGPHLFAAWLRAGLVDELCVTVRPVLAGGAGPLLVPQEVGFERLTGTPTHLLTWAGDVLVRTRLR